MEQTQTISIKDFRKIVKANGYKLKVVSLECMGNTSKYGEIQDLEGNFIVGYGANVYGKETIEKHRKAFDLAREYRDKVIDDNGKKVRGL